MDTCPDSGRGTLTQAHFSERLKLSSNELSSQFTPNEDSGWRDLKSNLNKTQDREKKKLELSLSER